MQKILKFFYSRKLAIGLLIVITALSFLETMFLRHRALGSIYKSWWFILIWLALFFNLACCNYLRIRKLWRRHKNQSKIRLSYKLPQHVLNVDSYSQDYLRGFKELLKKNRYKIQEGDDEIIGYKGRWAELWSIIFHLSFVIVMIAITYHQLTFFKGTIFLTEGQKLADNADNYLYYSKAKWGKTRSDYHLKLLDLNIDYYGNDKMEEMSGKLQIGNQYNRFEEKIKVNYPVYYGERKIALHAYGFSPKIVFLDKEGNVKLQSYVALDFTSGQEPRQTLFVIPNTDLALKIKIYPAYQFAKQEPGVKKLALNDFEFDIAVLKKHKSESKMIIKKHLQINEPLKFSGGTVLIGGLRYWGKFGVSSESGVNLIFFGFWLGVIGLACRVLFRYKRIGIKLVDDKQLLIDGKVDVNPNLFKREIKELVEEYKLKEEM